MHDTAEKFIIENMPRFTEPAFKKADAKDQPPSFKFVMEPMSSITLDVSSAYLIKDLMPSSGLHIVYGPPGSGKSFLALDAALHVAAGRTWAGRRVKKGGVVYIAAEGATGFRKRVLAAAEALGAGDKLPFALITRAPRISPTHCQLEELAKNIEAQCKKLKIVPSLIVLDTMSRVNGYEESSAEQMTLFINKLAKFGYDAKALVMLVHHTGKDQDKGMRGSSALNGAADAQWQLKKDDEGPFVHLEKMKDGPSGSQIRFSLMPVELGRDEDKDPITTQIVQDVRVVNADEAEGAARKNKSAKEKERAALLSMIVAKADIGKDRHPSLPDATKAAKTSAVLEDFTAMLLTGGYKPSSAVAKYNTTLREAKQAGLVKQADDWLWM